MLELTSVTKVFYPGTVNEKLAIDDVNLHINAGDVTCIVGSNGSGKSTLLNCLGGLEYIDSGEIIIKGKSSKDFSRSELDSYRNTYLGFIFQEYNILPEFTVGENIALAYELQGKKASQADIDNIMDEVDPHGLRTRKPTELSGGQSSV